MQKNDNNPLGVNYQSVDYGLYINSIKTEIIDGLIKSTIYKVFKEPDLMPFENEPEKLFNLIQEKWLKKQQQQQQQGVDSL
jgi:hypothetical protein